MRHFASIAELAKAAGEELGQSEWVEVSQEMIDRFAEATRRAVRHWGLEVQCEDPRHYSSALTAVRLPEGALPRS